MPCDQLRVTTVDIGKMDIGIFITAVSSLGYNVSKSGDIVLFNGASYSTKTGQLTTTNYSTVKRNEIVQAYAKQVVLMQSRKAGWSAVKIAPQLTTGR